jgi:two-component system LytT family response regulator
LRRVPPAKATEPTKAPSKAAERLVVKVSGEFHFIAPADIRWIEGHGDYLKIHCSKEAPLIRDTFKELQQRLDPTKFVRIHKSVMVNTDFVRRLRPALSGDYTVELDDGTTLRVSRLYKAALQQFL